MHIRNQ